MNELKTLAKMLTFLFVFAGAILFAGYATADVRVDIERVLPNQTTQYIVQQFDDFEAFSMWMEMKMENGCDPYVTKIHIDLHYKEFEGAKLGEY